MNKQTFINLIKDPTKISAEHIHGLEEVAANFPFCQIAHMLIAKGSNDYGSMHAEMKLKKAVVYSIERKKLRELLFKKAIKDKSTEEKNSSFPLAENKIPEITKANLPSEEKLIKDKKKFYETLEENLRLLHSLKSDAAKAAKEPPVEAGENLKAQSKPLEEEKEEKIELPTIENLPHEEPIHMEQETIGQENEVPETPEIAEKANENKEAERKLSIYSTRLEDLFLEQAGISAPSEADLMLEYLKFLNQNKSNIITDKKKQDEIITRFIKEDPSIPPVKPHSLPEIQEDLASESSRINKTPASENFAKILLLQGKKDMAIEIYQQLILKYPEKSAYFASQIEKIKS